MATALSVGAETGFELPVGAVVAFVGLQDCPEDWADLRGSEERFLRGRSPTETAGEVGKSGSDTHSHTGRTAQGGSGIGVDNDNDRHPSNNDHAHDFKTGDAQNIPEYVAVLFCRWKGNE